jgi:hypothetical protein
MVILGDYIVKSNKSTAFINKVGVRYYDKESIRGLAFEFSDGSKVNLSGHGDINTDPYTSSTPLMTTQWLDMPDGFDRLKWQANEPTLINLTFYKNGARIAHTVSNNSNCCEDSGELNVSTANHVASGITMHIGGEYWQIFHFRKLHSVYTGVAPINGGWSIWGGYNTCSKSCGDGEMKRTRVCDNPSPSFGGKECVGESVDFTPCKVSDCPLDGGWGPWADWGGCVDGNQYRDRHCNNPSALYGGAECVGYISQARGCVVKNDSSDVQANVFDELLYDNSGVVVDELLYDNSGVVVDESLDGNRGVVVDEPLDGNSDAVVDESNIFDRLTVEHFIIFVVIIVVILYMTNGYVSDSGLADSGLADSGLADSGLADSGATISGVGSLVV